MWWLVPIAWAQEEACAPVALAALEARLASAEAAVASGAADAASVAKAAHAEARCLDVPAPPAALGRLGWVLADLAAADLDEGLAWEWIRFARGVGAAEPPARASASLREVLTVEPPATEQGGPTGVVLAVPAKGVVYADGAPITEPRLPLSTPHLVQVFDKGARVSGAWQMGGSFPAYLLTNPDAATVRAARDRGGAALPPDTWKPRKDGTVEAYEAWIERHPDGPFVEDARDGIDDLRWAAAVSAGTELAAKQYLHDHPDGLHVKDARFVIEDLAYRRVMAAPAKAAWEKLLAEAPDGMYASEAKVQLDAIAWKEARTRDTTASYRAYVEAWPNGRYAERALQLETEKAFDLARGRGDDAILAFLQKWPESRWTDEARALLGEVRVERVAVVIDPATAPAVAAGLERSLREELGKRSIPVSASPSDPGTGRLRVSTGTEQKQGMTIVFALVALDFGTLERPLFEQRVEASVLATDDQATLLGKAVAANLQPLDRWRGKPGATAAPPPAP